MKIHENLLKVVNCFKIGTLSYRLSYLGYNCLFYPCLIKMPAIEPILVDSLAKIVSLQSRGILWLGLIVPNLWIYNLNLSTYWLTYFSANIFICTCFVLREIKSYFLVNILMFHLISDKTILIFPSCWLVCLLLLKIFLRGPVAS